MGRQSSRIYFQGQDHKEMVTWNGTGYQYHDKAYIWNGSEFELVWEKLYGLKLLYETTVSVKPVASGNDRYLYWTENDDDTIIYRLVIDAKNPEKVTQYEDENFNVFSAPTSSQGIGLHYKILSVNGSFSYRTLNLDTGGYGDGGTITPADVKESNIDRIQFSFGIKDEDKSIDLTGNQYHSVLGGYTWIYAYGLIWKIGLNGISWDLLNNTNYDDSLPTQVYMHALDRRESELEPRFLHFDSKIEQGVTLQAISVWENSIQYDYLIKSFYDDNLPFTLRGPVVDQSYIRSIRHNEAFIMDTNNDIWRIKVKSDSFEYQKIYEDDPSESEAWFDISPDHKRMLLCRSERGSGYKYDARIVDISTGKTIFTLPWIIYNRVTSIYFVGNKCLYMHGYLDPNSWTLYRRLYKWR